MGYVARFIKGAKQIEFDGTSLRLGLDFVPPAVSTSPLIATGTAANNRRGGSKRGETVNDRSLTFTINSRGNSEAHCRMLLYPLLALLNEAGDESEPLYFEFLGNTNVSVAPVWGQYGTPLRYEIIHASAIEAWDLYGSGSMREQVIHYTLSLMIKPYATGIPQKLAQAKGGLVEDNYGVDSGVARGTIIAEATTNKMTNPVFGSATWNTGWTADASLTAAENTDPAYLIPGTFSSAQLTALATGQEFYQSINVGNTNAHAFSCYARRRDGGAVSGTQLVLFYNTTLSTTFVPVGNGWYRCTATAIGISSSTNTGVQVKNGYSIYVTGFQCEERIYHTALAYGDMLGCAWTGTAHASTSTRTAAYMRIPYSTINVQESTVRVVWRANVSSSTMATDIYFWATDSVGFSARFIASSDIFSFTDAVNTADSSATSFAWNDVIILHYVFQPGSLKIYREGVQIATASVYTPNFNPSYIYIGSDATPTLHTVGTFLDFTVFDQGLTAAEALADATNIASHVRGGDGYGQRLMPIPYLWTKDGDNVVDNCDDSGRDNWAVAGGIPGNAAAETLFHLTMSANLTSTYGVYLSRFDTAFFVQPTNIIYKEAGGSADGTPDNSSNDNYLSQTVSTTAVTFVGLAPYGDTTQPVKYELSGRTYYLVARVYDAGSDLTMAFGDIGGIDSIITEYTPMSTTTAYRLYVSLPLTYSSNKSVFRKEGYEIAKFYPTLYLKRTTGSAAARLDYFVTMPAPMMEIAAPGYGYTGLLYKGTQARVMSGNEIVGSAQSLRGEAVELLPNRSNQLVSIIGWKNLTNEITYTMTYTKVEITPRWTLL